MKWRVYVAKTIRSSKNPADYKSLHLQKFTKRKAGVLTPSGRRPETRQLPGTVQRWQEPNANGGDPESDLVRVPVSIEFLIQW